MQDREGRKNASREDVFGKIPAVTLPSVPEEPNPSDFDSDVLRPVTPISYGSYTHRKVARATIQPSLPRIPQIFVRSPSLLQAKRKLKNMHFELSLGSANPKNPMLFCDLK